MDFTCAGTEANGDDIAEDSTSDAIRASNTKNMVILYLMNSISFVIILGR
jgi:hypothetical protein